MGLLSVMQERWPRFRAVHAKLAQMFGLDKRSLALFRIMFGLVVLGDLLSRMTDIEAHYTDRGIYTRGDLLSHYHGPEYLLIHGINGTYTFQVLLFSFHCMTTICFIVGFYTKTNALLTWLLLNSLQMHSPFVGHGGDVYARIVLFWALFMPTGEYWSVDAAIKRYGERPPRIVSKRASDLVIPDERLAAPTSSSSMPSSDFYGENLHKRHTVDEAPEAAHVDDTSSHDIIEKATSNKAKLSEAELMHLSFASVGLIAHLYLCYITSYYHKTGDEWKVTGDSAYFALNIAFFQLPLAHVFLLLPHEVLRFLCFAVLYWEHWGPLFLNLPVKTQPFRLFGVVGFWFMHSAFGLSLRIMEFYFFPMATFFALLPSMVWDQYVFPWTRTQKRLSMRVLIDPSSSFSRLVGLIIREFLLVEGSFVEYSTDVPSVLRVYTDTHAELHGYKAWVYCVRMSPLWWFGGFIIPLISFSGLTKLFDGVFTFLHNASADDKAAEMSVPKRKLSSSSSGPHGSRRFHNKTQERVHYANLTLLFTKEICIQLFCLYCILLSMGWNFQNFKIDAISVPRNQHWVVWFLRLDQGWNMFSPQPPHASFFFTIPGYLVNNTKVELFRNGGLWSWEPNAEVDFGFPKDIYKDFRSHRWFKFFENGFVPQQDYLRLSFGRWICREFNKRHQVAEQLYNYTIYYISREVFLDGSTKMIEPQALWEHQCFDKHPEIPSPTQPISTGAEASHGGEITKQNAEGGKEEVVSISLTGAEAAKPANTGL